MSFRAEAKRAIQAARNDRKIPEDSVRRALRAYDLRGAKAQRFWEQAESQVADLYAPSDPRPAADRKRKIDWAAVRKWLRDHVLQIVQIFLALLMLCA